VLHVSARWVSQNLSAHDRHWWVALSQELLGSYTSDEELFCHCLVTGDKTWIYHWAPLSKLEFIHWKDVGRPTFTRICNFTFLVPAYPGCPGKQQQQQRPFNGL